MDVVITAYRDNGEVIAQDNFEPSVIEWDEPIRLVEGFIRKHDFMSDGETCCVEAVGRGTGHGWAWFKTERKWFTVERKKVSPRCEFYELEQNGDKKKVDIVGRVRSAQAEAPEENLYFQVDRCTPIGIMFYDLDTVIPFLSNFEKFRLHGRDYVQVSTPGRSEYVISKIMG